MKGWVTVFSCIGGMGGRQAPSDPFSSPTIALPPNVKENWSVTIFCPNKGQINYFYPFLGKAKVHA